MRSVVFSCKTLYILKLRILKKNIFLALDVLREVVKIENGGSKFLKFHELPPLCYDFINRLLTLELSLVQRSGL